MSEAVLVVDDSATLRRIVEAALADAGWTVWSAANGREALAQLAAHDEPPRLVLSDWNMPEMNGLELLRALRGHERYAHLPILILTTETDAASKAAARDAGATGWLDKPVDVPLLHDVIRSVLN